MEHRGKYGLFSRTSFEFFPKTTVFIRKITLHVLSCQKFNPLVFFFSNLFGDV